MKIITKLILIIFFIPTILLVVISSTLKFQLLDFKFWQNNFKVNNVYVILSQDVKKYVENQNIKGGGKTEDLKILTDIITPDLTEDIVIHNLNNFLNFVNGKNEKFLVYIPVKKLPKEFIPTSVDLQSEEIAFKNLISKFNFTLPLDLPVSQIAYLGLFVNYLFFGSIILSISFALLLYKFKSLGLGLIFSGIFILILSLSIFLIRESFSSQIILSTFMPYILQEMLKVWGIVGGVILGLGLICFYLERRIYAKR